MNLFSTNRMKHIDGHKHPSQDVEVRSLSPEKVPVVYFPLVNPKAQPIKVLVAVGDKVQVGDQIALREDMYVPVFSSVSGEVIENVDKFHPLTGRTVPHLAIKNDGQYTKGKGLKTLTLEASREDIVAAIKKAGIVGLGGAGFPTYIKYNNVKGIDTLLINGVECEPFLTTDFVTMKAEAKRLLDGVTLLMRASEAPRALVAIKKGKELVANAIKEELVNYPNVSLKEVPDAYPMGWERTLIWKVLGREYDMLPSECHVVVNNAQTAIAIARALLEGQPVTERVMTVSGDVVKNPSNIIVPVGTPVANVLGEYEIDESKPIHLLAGGPMTSNAITNFDFVTLPQNGGFTLLKPVKYDEVACLRCGACTSHCPASLQPVEIKLAVEGRDIVRIEKLNAMKCIECGLCSYVCPSKIEVTEFMKKAKTILRAEAAKKARAGK